MKLKTYVTLLSILTVLDIFVLALSSKGIPITKISISKIGSLDGNYFFFLLSTSILILMFSIFLHKMYATLQHTPRKELYAIPLLSIVALLFKAGLEPSLGKIVHTILFVATGICVLIVMYDINKICLEKNKLDRKILAIPKIALFGTIAIFILIGLNVITELFYISTVISWMHIIGAAAASSSM